MKIYIAGKITGDPKYRDRFRDEAEKLEALGHIVLNPAELPEGMSKAEYMRICFAMIDCADMVFLLPGWQGSPGGAAGAGLLQLHRQAIGQELGGGHMSDKKRESRSRRLVTIRVTPMTYRHLCAMAEVSGLKYPGQAVDKLVRSLALQARDARRGVWRSE